MGGGAEEEGDADSLLRREPNAGIDSTIQGPRPDPKADA